MKRTFIVKGCNVLHHAVMEVGVRLNDEHPMHKGMFVAMQTAEHKGDDVLVTCNYARKCNTDAIGEVNH